MKSIFHHLLLIIIIIIIEISILAQSQDDCSSDGSSSKYEEMFLGSSHHSYDNRNALRRYIQASGCPNHPYNNLNPNTGQVQDFEYSIPAYPFFNGASYADALENGIVDISQQSGDVALTFNGVAVYTAWAGQYDYDGDGSSYDDDDEAAYGEESNAVTAEGDTFDWCGGHSSGAAAGYQYHYHVPPTCLIAQMGYDANSHSVQIGWMYDGFPVYGPRGPNGVMMIRCGQVGAHETICLDKCNVSVDNGVFICFITRSPLLSLSLPHLNSFSTHHFMITGILL